MKQEHEFGKGALVTPTIKKMPTLGRSSIPFDWDEGFDVGELITKDQGSSSSCGGQATSYKGEADTKIPKSARFPYCQVYVGTGGSSEQDLIKIVKTEGLADESIFPSYDKGQVPTESFMQNDLDITSSVLLNASTLEGIPVYVYLDFDSMAQAVRDNKGIIIGIYGTNNGTWLSPNPKPPMSLSGNWAHWVYVGRAKTINGKKTLSFKNSWGDGVGSNGWQSITEDYLPYIFSAWTFQRSGGYKFTQYMQMGSVGEQVFALQAELGIKPTGWFGPKTMAYVMAYQKAHGVLPLGVVGPITRASLNSA